LFCADWHALYIGKLWTYPERMTKDNIDELRKWKLNGNDEYPRARFVEHPNDDKKFLKDKGDIV